MEILNTVFTFVSNNILTKAEFFVGLIVLVGYILLGRKWYETLAGFLKAVVGYMILNVGSAGLINTFRPILAGLNQKFHLNAVVIDPYFGLNAVNAALENIGLSAAWTMTSLLLAFIWNIILLIFRKFTKLRTLLLTGHIMVRYLKSDSTDVSAVLMNKKHSQGLWKAVSQLQIQSLFHNIYDKVYKQSHRWYKSGELGLFLK